MGGRWGPYGFINKTGDLVVPAKFAEAYDFSEGVASVAVLATRDRGYIDKLGQFRIAPTYHYAMPFSEGFAAVSPTGQRLKYFINQDGNRAFSGDYLGVDRFQNGLCFVSTEKTISYIDRFGRPVWEGPYVAGR